MVVFLSLDAMGIGQLPAKSFANPKSTVPGDVDLVFKQHAVRFFPSLGRSLVHLESRLARPRGAMSKWTFSRIQTNLLRAVGLPQPPRKTPGSRTSPPLRRAFPARRSRRWRGGRQSSAAHRPRAKSRERWEPSGTGLGGLVDLYANAGSPKQRLQLLLRLTLYHLIMAHYSTI